MSTHPNGPPRPPGAVVFDVDGLLLDTERCWTEAEAAQFARHGRTLTAEHKRRLVGSSLSEAGLMLEVWLDQPGRADELALELMEMVRGTITTTASPMPGAVEIVGSLRGRVPIAVASNTWRELLEGALAAAGFEGVFDAVVAGDDVVEPKPAPDIYLWACSQLGVEPTSAIALEDSPSGSRAAHAAGMFVIGIPSMEGIELDHAHLLRGSLEDATVLRILNP